MQKYAFLDRDGTFLFEPKKPKSADPRNTFPLKSMKDVIAESQKLEGLKIS